MASSNGFSDEYQNSWLWMGSNLTLKDADGKLNEAGMWGGGAYREDLPSPAEIAGIALERGKRRLGSTKGPTRKTAMVVENASAGRLIGRLLSGASGRSVERDQSFWKGRLGTQAVSEKLTIVDDPLIVRGLASRPFDSEGIAARPLPLIEAGVLQNYYLDTYYAKKLGMDPTTGSASNRVIGLGEHDLDALLAQTGDGIFVTSWLGGNADGTTGDFSFGIRGHRIDNGQLGAPIGEMNVTGNLLDLFGQLVAIGNDPWPYSSMKAPTLVFEGVDFSGA
jgi:PmbA protein